jgi:membrane protease YdiL (CAAX protease family)
VAWWPAPVRWTAAEIALILLLMPLLLTLSAEVLTAGGFYRWFYGPGLPEAARDTALPRQVAAATVVAGLGGTTAGGAAAAALVGSATGQEHLRRQQQKLAWYRLALWSGALAFFLQLAATLSLLYLFSGVRPRDLGLTTRRLRHNVVAGVVGALVLTPGALGLNLLAVALFRAAGGDTQEHPFAQLGQVHLHPAEWVLLVVAATLFAPVWEELLFRGILQPWFATRRWGPHLALLAAFAAALLTRSDRLAEARGQGPHALLQECVPALGVLALLPVYALVWWRSRTPVGPALFATAVLFAWVHARVWPSPIALTFLALGLGWLAWRTQSLVGPIVVHSLFNGTACLLLIVQVLHGK